MQQADESDHLSSSLTDLMTSLMVIFILLLLVFMNRQTGAAVTRTKALYHALKTQFPNGQFTSIKQSGDTVVLVASRSLEFHSGESTLEPRGIVFLQQTMPKLAGVICSRRFKSLVDSVVVEGHTDLVWKGATSTEQAREKNLRLSQDRSMQVVEDSLGTISAVDTRSCLLSKLSATGRGDQGCKAEDNPKCRHVLFRVHVSQAAAQQLGEAVSK